MVMAILKNGEVNFTEENSLINEDNCELATYNDVLDCLCMWVVNLVEGCLIQVKEGIGIINDDNGFEILVKI